MKYIEENLDLLEDISQEYFESHPRVTESPISLELKLYIGKDLPEEYEIIHQWMDENPGLSKKLLFLCTDTTLIMNAFYCDLNFVFSIFYEIERMVFSIAREGNVLQDERYDLNLEILNAIFRLQLSKMKKDKLEKQNLE